MSFKNLVFIIDIDLKGDGRYSPNRRLAYKYTIDSWKQWCNKNNYNLVYINNSNNHFFIMFNSNSACHNGCFNIRYSYFVSIGTSNKKYGRK